MSLITVPRRENPISGGRDGMPELFNRQICFQAGIIYSDVLTTLQQRDDPTYHPIVRRGARPAWQRDDSARYG